MTTATELPHFPQLQTARLRLRELTEADVETIFAIYSDAEAMRWFGSEPLTERKQAEAVIRSFADWRKMPNPGTRWGLERLSDGQLVGSCGLFKWNRQWSACTLGYELGRAAWGQGLMREALQAVLRYGFNEMLLQRVQAEIHPDNHASIELVRKLGFQYEGCLRQLGYWMGQRHDLHCYSLLREEFDRS